MSTVLPDYWTHEASVIDNPLPFIVPVGREVAFGTMKKVIEDFALEKEDWRIISADQYNFQLVHSIAFDSEIGRLKEQVQLTTRVSLVYGYTRVQMNFFVSLPSFRQTYAPKRLIMPNMTPPLVDTYLTQFYQLVKNEMRGESMDNVLTEFNLSPELTRLHDLVISFLMNYGQEQPPKDLVAHLTEYPDSAPQAKKYLACSPGYELMSPYLATIPGY